MKKGKVIDIRKDCIVVLTQEKEYVKLKKKQGEEEGSEIYFFEEDLIKENKTIIYKTFALVAATLMLFFNIFPNNNVENNMVSFAEDTFAVVSVDINPSIELEIDENLKVIDVKSYNKDGNRIVDKNKIIGKYFTIAIKDVVENADTKGYFEGTDKDVLISVAPIKEEFSSEVDLVEKQLKYMAIEEKDKKYIYMESQNGEIEKSRKEGISLGKYVVYEDCKNEKNIEIEEIKKMKVTELDNKGMLTNKGEYLNSKNSLNESSEKENSKVENDHEVFILKTGIEYVDIRFLNELGIKVSIDLPNEIITTEKHGKFFNLTKEKNLIIKENRYFINLKDVLDYYNIKYNYKGSVIQVDYGKEKIQLKHLEETDFLNKNISKQIKKESNKEKNTKIITKNNGTEKKETIDEKETLIEETTDTHTNPYLNPIIINHGNEYIDINYLEKFKIIPTFNDENNSLEILIGENKIEIEFSKEQLPIKQESKVFVPMKKTFEEIGIKFEVKKGYVYTEKEDIKESFKYSNLD
ncbi:anti-sigma factor domain-containing protein [Tepidibacter hydrothermalis]|uniref:Anti-sigma factor domain-containing protein n=1 Tax=Tepidibacter hydrothermalis TaxID=3036126 RepID=A0ABY8ECD7_9FIRM|nr:anti-sigma factor domain-containing protein [Tepidibacter hydrothermalis]WFD10471.1 anti-sigma factor domain-containing protein [Tepidibacter hydrothermalis]